MRTTTIYKNDGGITPLLYYYYYYYYYYYTIQTLPQDRDIYIHCKGGMRGHIALRILASKGMRRVKNITGGWSAMVAEEGFEVEKTTTS